MAALAVSSKLDFSQYSCLVNSLVAYLEHQRFRDICILQQGLLEEVLLVLKRSYVIHVDDQLSSDDLQALSQLRLKINQTLAEISGSPLFLSHYTLDSRLAQTLISWLRSANEEQLQICACLVLGNLARSDTICQRMVQEFGIHKYLTSVLKSNAPGAVLHSALGFLKNLAIARDNKVYLGDVGVIPAVSRLWSFQTMPEVEFAAATLLRQVIAFCLENVSRLLAPISTDPASSAHTQTYLSLLLSLFEKTDSELIKIDIGRTIVSILRTLSPKTCAENQEARTLYERFLKLHNHVAHPIGSMVVQSQWPVVRSEGWFALALMASNRPGSLAVVDCLGNGDVSKLLIQTLDAKLPERVVEADRARIAKDRDNGIILMKELLENAVSTWISLDILIILGANILFSLVKSDVLPPSLKAVPEGYMHDGIALRLKSSDDSAP